jgi:hypothetical protein
MPASTSTNPPSTITDGKLHRRNSWPKASAPSASSSGASREEPASSRPQVIGWSRDSEVIVQQQGSIYAQQMRCTILSGPAAACENNDGAIATMACKTELRCTKMALSFKPVEHPRKEDARREHAPRSWAKNVHSKKAGRANVMRGRRDLNGAVNMNRHAQLA